MLDIETLFFTIVSRGKANAVLEKAEECGASGGTIFLGEGTVQSKLLEGLGLTETPKEILMISASEELSECLHENLSETFLYSKRNHGIAFTIPFKRHKLKNTKQETVAGETTSKEPNFQYDCIITIVDKGRSRDCVKAARAAGARGGTLIHGHGAGIPTDFYYPLVIEPQKDIVLHITPKDKSDAIRERIISDLELGKTGNGIIFTLPVNRTSGLYEDRTGEHEGVTS
ncbi:MAG: P-II family nitrogen regulator [Clostridiales bacterium]|nr:P-II family nitrogen regulator [Clostridiales bacterium]